MVNPRDIAGNKKKMKKKKKQRDREPHRQTETVTNKDIDILPEIETKKNTDRQRH